MSRSAPLLPRSRNERGRAAAARLMGKLISIGLLATAVTASAAEPPIPIEGTWMPERYSDRLLTASGEAPPLTPEAEALYAERIATNNDPDRQYDRTLWCAGPGMPRIMFMPYAFEIRADADFIGFIHDFYRWHRMVDMSGREPDPLLPQTMGYPTGRWEGETLVVETEGLSEETVLDAMGLPHSGDMRLEERISLLPDGRLQARYTIEDPEYYSRPWEAVMTYRRAPEIVVGDDVCPDRLPAGEPPIRRALP